MVTLLDVGAAVEELRHAVTTLGFKGVDLGRTPPAGGRCRPAHDRFWAEAERLGVPVMFHEGTDGQLPTAGLDRFDNFFMTHMISHPFEQMLAALSMIAGGVVERFPRLKVAFLESGCGWLPFGCTACTSTGRSDRTRYRGSDRSDRMLPPAMHDLMGSGRSDNPGGGRFYRRGLRLLGVGLSALGCDLPWRGRGVAARHDRAQRDRATQDSRRQRRRFMGLPG